MKRANQTFEYVLENIEECKHSQLKWAEKVASQRDITSIQESHLEQELRRANTLRQERMDRQQLGATSRYIAQQLYEEKTKKNKVGHAWKLLRMLKTLFGGNRMAKRSINKSLNSMLSDTEKTQKHAMDILKDIQQTSDDKSFFDRSRDVTQSIDTRLVQEAQCKLLAC